MELFNVLTLKEIEERMTQAFPGVALAHERLPLAQGLGRILAEDLIAEEAVPHFSRSVVDGYAVKAKDTFGASESIPGFLSVKGSVEMGQPANLDVKAGEAVYVPTGGALPAGADAVVMIEYTEPFGVRQIAVHRPAAPLENLMKAGDDVAVGEVILRQGARLRAQDLGVLAALGQETVTVFAPLKVSLISTGDEIVPLHESPQPGQIRDINSHAVAGLIHTARASLQRSVLIRDNFEALRAALADALEDSDLVLLSGGSSVGEKDYTQRVIASFEKAQILAHGLAIKPGKPTVVAQIDGKPVFGLPGQPASAMMIFKAIVEPLIQRLSGESFLPMVSGSSRDFPVESLPELRSRVINAKSSANIHAAPGRTTFQMVALRFKAGEWIADPVHGKSGMISLMSRADGYIQMEPEQEGLHQNEWARVILF